MQKEVSYTFNILRKDIEAREQIVFAQSLAGMAFNNASLGYVHAIAHQFGGFYNYPHGFCNAILLPHVCKFNLIAREERYAEIAAALGENISGLSTLEAAENAMKDACAATNPRKA